MPGVRRRISPSSGDRTATPLPADVWREDHYARRLARREESLDPCVEGDEAPRRVVRGGGWPPPCRFHHLYSFRSSVDDGHVPFVVAFAGSRGEVVQPLDLRGAQL